MYRLMNEEVLENCIRELRSLPFGKYQLEIRETKRTLNQNALYWKWLTIIGNDIGYSAEDLHEACKRQFLGCENGKDIFGNLYIRPKSSAKLKKSEFTEYMNKVYAFAMSRNIALPTPDYYGG